MEQDNKKNEFRAIYSKKQSYLCLVIWIILYVLFYILFNVLFDSRESGIFTNMKVFLLSFLLSILSLFLISQFFISSVLNFQLNSQKISIFKNKKKLIDIPLSEISKVEFGTSTIFINLTFIHFFFNNKNIILLTGFLFTSKKGTIQLKNFYFNYFRKYMLSNFFINEDTAKIKKNNNFAERFTPITKKD